MSEGIRTSRLQLGLILLISLTPLVFAWIAYSVPGVMGVKKTMNYGTLVVPPVPVGDIKLAPADNKRPGPALEAIKGRWVLIHTLPEGTCGDVCRGSLSSTAKIRLMMNKDLIRIKRLLVSITDYPKNLQSALSSNGGEVVFAQVDNAFMDRLSRVSDRAADAGVVYLMDPLGNLMMWYAPGFDPYGMHKDLQRLLKVSQIG